MTTRDETAEDIEALLMAAARHACAYRTTPAEHQRAAASYAQSVAAFDDVLPEEGEPAEAVLEELVRRAEPGLHASTGPRFFGWVIGNSHPMGVAADFLTSAWGQNTANHVAAPAAAAAETVAARWLLDILRLPPESSVGFVTGATMANFTALAAARGEVLRRAGWDVDAQGLFGAPPVRVLIGEDAHASVFSALHYLGFGQASLLRVPADAQGVMCPDAFERTLAREVPAGAPLIAVTQAGHIHSGATDAHERLVPLVRARCGWVHVDGAFGLWARACPARAPLARGVEEADSWATDGHKWLQTPFDCGYVIVRDAEAHRRAMTIAASYLPPVTEGERDPSHYVPELSRRARGFASWALLRHFGRAGIAAMVERHCAQARLLAGLLADEPGIAVLNEVVLNQVAVRFGPADTNGDGQTLAAIAALQEDGTCFAGAARWRGRWILRLSVIGASTTDDDIRLSAQAIIRSWRHVASLPAAV